MRVIYMVYNKLLPKTSKKEFLSALSHRKYEDVALIRTIEKLLLQKRGYVFRMPPAGSPVILLVSGGLDSIPSWSMLMEEYKLRVFPITIDKGGRSRRKEEKSIDFFSQLYRKRYPKLFVEPFNIDVSLRELAIPIESAMKEIHPGVIMEFLDEYGNMKSNLSLGSFTLSPILAKLYAQYLYLKQHIRINTIFCAITANDGIGVPEQTFTTLRVAMWFLCVTTGNYNWQFSSVMLEKEMGIFFRKEDMIRWAIAKNLPLEKTWSCFRAGRHQCGDKCMTCWSRRDAFRKAGVEDKTIYQRDHAVFIKAYLMRILDPVKRYGKMVLRSAWRR